MCMNNLNYLIDAMDTVLTWDLPEALIPLAINDQAKLLAGYEAETLARPAGVTLRGLASCSRIEMGSAMRGAASRRAGLCRGGHAKPKIGLGR